MMGEAIELRGKPEFYDGLDASLRCAAPAPATLPLLYCVRPINHPGNSLVDHITMKEVELPDGTKERRWYTWRR